MLKPSRVFWAVVAAVVAGFVLCPISAAAQEPGQPVPPAAEKADDQPAEATSEKSAVEKKEEWPFKTPAEAVRLSRTGRVWVDTKRKNVISDGDVFRVKQ